MFSRPFGLTLETTQTAVQQVPECEADGWPLFVTELQILGDVPLFVDMSAVVQRVKLEIRYKEDNLEFRIAFFCRHGLGILVCTFPPTYTSARHHRDAL